MAKFDLGKYKITPKGEYNADTTYEELDLITYNNSSFLALKSVTGITPSDDGVNYQLIASGVDPKEIAGKADKTYVDGELETKAEKSYVEQNYANAVKGTGTGTAMLFDDVSPIAHKVKVSGTAGDGFRVFGKNLWNTNMRFLNSENNGLTLTNNGDGTVTISGTPTAATTFRNNSVTVGYITLPIGVYSFDSVFLNFNTLTVADNTLKQFRGGKITATEPLKVTQAFIYFNNEWVGKEVNFTFNMQLNVGAVYDTEYVPYQAPTSYYLDESGNLEIDSVAPSMTILADSDVSVTYNRDTSKVINQLLIDNENLKNAVTALGGTI